MECHDYLRSDVDLHDRHRVISEDIHHLDGDLAPPGYAFMKHAGQLYRPVFFGAEGLPFVLEDVIPGPVSPPTRRSLRLLTRMISRLLSKSKSTAQ